MVDGLRFGLVCDAAESTPVEVAQRAEAHGYSTVLFPDHLGMLAPVPAMVAAAAVTSRLRVGTQVINPVFRNLGVLAQEAASVDVLSDGRLELGLGAGHADEEAAAVGLKLKSPIERIANVAGTVGALRRLFGGEEVSGHFGDHTLDQYRLSPTPVQGADLPIMVGGNGTRLLQAAAAGADIVQISGFSPTSTGGLDYRYFSWDGLLDRVRVVRSAGGEHGRSPELSIVVSRAMVVEDAESVLRSLPVVQRGMLSLQAAAASPFLLIGTRAHVEEQLHKLHERAGVSYVTVFDVRSAGFDAVVAGSSAT